jgi:hypothetical protein
MLLTTGQIIDVRRDPPAVFVMVWPARVLEIPVRDVDEYAGRTGRVVRVEVEEDDT